MSNASALYEGHLELVEILRKRAVDVATMSRYEGQYHDLKDVTTAYVMAIDKFLSFSQFSFTTGGERTPMFPAMDTAAQQAEQARQARDLGT